MSVEDTPSAKVFAQLREIDEASWARCAGSRNPFVGYPFLSALEDSGSATAETGWLPQHIAVVDGSGQIRAAMPLYLKSHSLGEYVFDHSWAAAFERAGGRYYPKLQCSVPFTPAMGPRLLVPEQEDQLLARRHLLACALTLAERRDVSSLHVTFAPKDEAEFFRDSGLLIRTDQQFHWQNQGYHCFGDFLANLASRKRKLIRRERRDALGDGLGVEILRGADISEAHWDHFFDFYTDTGRRKWGRPYLNRHFFSLVGERMGERIVLTMAKRGGRYIAGALNIAGADTLYGRYWGCTEHHKFLHFELCYYQAIEWAIAHGLSRVEAGAQGEHKLARGYVPTRTYSAHWIANPDLRRAVAEYLDYEKESTENTISILSSFSPFKKPIRN